MTDNTNKKENTPLDSTANNDLLDNKESSEAITSSPEEQQKAEKETTPQVENESKESDSQSPDEVVPTTNINQDVSSADSENAEIVVNTNDSEATKSEKKEAEISEEDAKTKQFLEKITQTDFSVNTKEELKSTFNDLLSISDIAAVKEVAEEIKSAFYKKHRAEIVEKQEAFLADGGIIEDFKYADPVESEFKDIYQTFKDRKVKINQEQEKAKQENLALRHTIIDEIKELINKEESIEQTFREFRDLQERWKNIGQIPQNEIKDIWETYHHNVSKFYDYIKINKELRDLDLKKNYESKISLCEQAESLIIEEAIVKAFAKLQKLHDQWREIGPVLHDKKDELWQRFKNATTQINKKHQEYFLQLKDQEKTNLEAKIHICEKVEELLLHEFNSPKDWTDKSKEIIELQKMWRTIGFAPKKYNNQVYDRFRVACDKFFNKKRDYFHELKSEEETNKQKKLDLCIQAESLQKSTDWKNTTIELINIQKDWKKIGPVPKKDSDKLWQRFRSACDNFFNAKESHFSKLDGEQDENLEKKLALIEQLEKMELAEKVEDNLATLQRIQKEWGEIGFIPLKQKDKVNNKFRDLLSQKFDELNIDEQKIKMLKYKVKLNGIKNAKQPDGKIRFEKTKILTKLKTLQSDIVLLENNIGFFANSNNAESLIKDVEMKIIKGKEEIEVLKKQLRLLDELDENM